MNTCTITETDEATTHDFSRHPCYNAGVQHTTARIHLPVAPRCNIQCNYCNRKFDCVNESRPGVSSSVLSPAQAVSYLDEMREKVPSLAVVGIAGPGDPFANPHETMETLRLVRKRHPDLMLCLASNGLGIGPHIDELIDLGVHHVTITINAVDPSIGAIVYRWIRDGKKPMRGEEAAQVLIRRQLDALARLADAGVLVKVNSIVIPGVNDAHIEEIARTAKQLGAQMMNCIPLMPVPDTGFSHLPEPDATELFKLRLRAGNHVQQMTHCARCRADAVGLVGEDNPESANEALVRHSKAAGTLDASRPYVAVGSQEGVLVNLHLGEIGHALIYRLEDDGGFAHVDTRTMPPPGGGEERWKKTAALLNDCRVLLCAAAGPAPRRTLEHFGLPVVQMEGLIEEGLTVIYEEREMPASLSKRFTSCGDGCRGTGTGCG